MVLALAALPAAQADAAESKLLLEVVINGRDTQKIADFVQRGVSAIYASRADLRDLGLSLPAAKGARDADLVGLSDLPGLSYRIDGPHQTIEITAADRALIASNLNAPAGPSGAATLRTGTGAVLNYDFTETYGPGGGIAVHSLLDGRVFTAGGVLTTQYLLGTGAGEGAIRLDSTLSYADPDTLRVYRAGDIINGGLAWSRPVRLGGLQLQSDFAIRPDLVTFPLPQIAGSAAVPSSVDVLINNVHLLSHSVDPGPFALTQLPIVGGASTVTVVTKDALGQETTQTLPFYTTSRLLLPGLAAYSAEIGAIRNAYGLRSDDYTRPAGSGTLRYGLSRLVTLEAHGEAGPSLGLVGGGAVVKLGQFGVLTASAAGSARGGRQGQQVAIGFERVTRRFSVSALVLQASRSYADLAALDGDPVPRRQMRVSAGTVFGRAGALSLAYTVLDTSPSLVASRIANAAPLASEEDFGVSGPRLVQPDHTALLSATYTATVWRGVQGYATGFHDFAHGASAGLVFGLSVPLGQRSSASVTAQSAGGNSNLTEQISRAAVAPGEIGGTLLNQNGTQNRQMLELDAVSRVGGLTVGIDRLGGQSAYRASQAGALATLDGGIYASPTIPDSFAVIDTGLPHIAVFQENRPAGTTDDKGRLLLANLPSYAANQIALDPASVPMNAELQSAVQLVRAPAQTGVVVKFALRHTASASVHLVDQAGAPLPVGSIVVVGSAPARNVVGFDGVAFLHDLAPHNMAQVSRPDGHSCTAAFDFVQQGDHLPDLGKVTCRAAPR